MTNLTDVLRPDERLTLSLRALYEQYGYRQFRMTRFEPYDFYALHRDFLTGGQILSFTDLNGSLMALRPDVTLSIVKKIPDTLDGGIRMYYTESVFRPDSGGMRYRESPQVGIESIGPWTPYTAMEIITLAQKSLQSISEKYILDLSHTQYVTGLLESLPVDASARAALGKCIAQKNMHEIGALVQDLLTPEAAQRLMDIARLSGPAEDALPKAKAWAINETMCAAVQDLSALCQALKAVGMADALRLDFSVTSDANYYCGIIMRGYIDSVPSAVLSGGRYDPLLVRMGKAGISAMGFAIYFDELAQFLNGPPPDDSVDTAVLYAPASDPVCVVRAVQAATAQQKRIWAGTALPQGLAYTEIVEVPPC